ncbi:MAG: bifunctional diaminohydroxyphosphoribosylaminopyrimidine deaminase/5-amino-6-(5-phosphoribosylamino)uracil reductase RibD [Aquificae bacterium]|nr:bifunctional diaminohydroxyphosphoribosylaminopyrimidine deaminase/5-amino-6-(5-phosphoribosylamino)uracil reductase RibD [Aquificota bacterium]
MRRALALASVRKGLTHPNPTVGCVIVKDGKVVGEGFHRKAGEPHAEVVALRRAGENAKGATVFVTLEPCAHYGRTPPCSLALIRAGVKRVVVATLDPNPKVAGRGIEALRRAGIEVEVGLLDEEARRLNEDFFWWITRRRPFVVLKVAQTLDGFVALPSGESKWITSERSRRLVHRMRCESDAVLVGVSTVLRDDPLLTVRSVPCEKKPLRVVLDAALRTPLGAKVADPSLGPTLIFTAEGMEKGEKADLLRKKGVQVVPVPRDEENPSHLSLEAVLDHLGKEREVVRLLVEGGPTVFGSFLKKGLFNRLSVFVAPKIFGTGLSPFGGPKASTPEGAVKLRPEEVRKVGEDLLLEFVRS